MISKTIYLSKFKNDQIIKMMKMQLVDGSNTNRGKTKVFTFLKSHKNL